MTLEEVRAELDRISDEMENASPQDLRVLRSRRERLLDAITLSPFTRRALARELPGKVYA